MNYNTSMFYIIRYFNKFHIENIEFVNNKTDILPSPNYTIKLRESLSFVRAYFACFISQIITYYY